MGTRLEKIRKVAVLVPGTPGSPGDPGQPYIAGHWETRWRWVSWGDWWYDAPPDFQPHWESYKVWIPEQPYVPPTPPIPPTPPVLEEDYQLGWNAGAYSIEMKAGNVALSFTLDTGNIGIVIGLTTPEEVSGESYQSIRYGVYIDREQARVIESGQFVSPIVLFESGALFVIRRVGRAVSYWIGGQLVAISAKASTEPELQADCSIYSGLDAIDDAAFSVPQAMAVGEGSLLPLTGLGRALRPEVIAVGRLCWLEGHGEQEPPGIGEARLAPLIGTAQEGESVEGRARLLPMTGAGRSGGSAHGAAWLQPLNVVAEAGSGNRPGAAEGLAMLRSLSGLAKGGSAAVRATGSLVPLTGQGQSIRPPEPAAAMGRLRPLTGLAGTSLNTAAGEAWLAALTGSAFEDGADDHTLGVAAFMPLAASGRGAEAAEGFAALQALGGMAGEDDSLVVGTGRLLPLTGTGRSGETATGAGFWMPLTGIGWEPTAQRKVAEGRGAFLPLEGTAREPKLPAVAHGVGSFEALQGFGYEKVQGAVSMVQRLQPLTGFGSTKELTRGYQIAALQPLTGYAADQAYSQGVGRFQALTGSGLGGLIQPRPPSWGWVMLMPLTAGARTFTTGPAHGMGAFQPLKGKGGKPYTWGEGSLQPLTGYALQMPEIYCYRYMPRLMAAARGLRLGAVSASIPTWANAAIAASRTRTNQSDAVVAQPRTLWASASAHIALGSEVAAQANAVVAKERHRSARANAWICKRQTLSASFDVAIEP